MGNCFCSRCQDVFSPATVGSKLCNTCQIKLAMEHYGVDVIAENLSRNKQDAKKYAADISQAEERGFRLAINTLSWMAHAGTTWNGRVINCPSFDHVWKEYLAMRKSNE